MTERQEQTKKLLFALREIKQVEWLKAKSGVASALPGLFDRLPEIEQLCHRIFIRGFHEGMKASQKLTEEIRNG